MNVNNPTKIITHHALSLISHTHLDVAQWHFQHFGQYTDMRSRLGTFTGYHYVINWDGSVHKTRELDEEGMHTRGQNTSSIGVCFMGNFDNHRPSSFQIDAWRKLYAEIGNGMPVYPHRKYATKSCHGRLLSDTFFAELVNAERRTQLIERINQLTSLLTSLLLQRRMR